jgi:hypothetical protein
MLSRTTYRLAAAAGLMLALGLSAQPAAAAKKKSCLRGGAKLEAFSGKTVVVRVKAKKRSEQETRRENLLACWSTTGKRVKVADEVDFGLDNIASSQIEIVQGRYVGVIETNEGGVSLGVQARVFDARARKKLHDSAICDKVDQGDFGGVDDVAFLEGGGMAMSCRQLIVFRNAGSAAEAIEPAGTDVRQIGVSHNTRGFGQRLFWTVASADGETTKSLVL